MQLSNGEKLLAIMLADIMEAGSIDGEIEPAFVKNAIFSDQMWSLRWQYGGLFNSDEADPPAVQETASILTMCSYVEYSIKQLTPSERSELADDADNVFVGFDGNHDDHYGIADTFINKMNRWDEFKGRYLNSHHTVMPKYLRMVEVFQAIGPTDGGLTLDEIKAILEA